jgi:hypothetical protein
MALQAVPLGTALSIVHNAPLCGLREMTEALRALLRRPLRQHELPYAFAAAHKQLLHQHGWLRDVTPPWRHIEHGDWAYVWAWLDTQQHRHGQYVLIACTAEDMADLRKRRKK